MKPPAGSVKNNSIALTGCLLTKLWQNGCNRSPGTVRRFLPTQLRSYTVTQLHKVLQKRDHHLPPMYPTKVCRRHFFCQANILNVRDICLGNDIGVGIKIVLFLAFLYYYPIFLCNFTAELWPMAEFFECCATIWDNIIVILQLNLDGGDAYSFLCS